MKRQKILHVVSLEKFIPPFIELLERQECFSANSFVVIGGEKKFQIKKRNNIVFLSEYSNIFLAIINLIRFINKADKVVLHGLFNPRVVLLLFFQPWILSKCYWVLWGGDLYTYKFGERDWKWYLKEFIRRPVIKNIKCITTTVPGDYDLVKKWYKTRAGYIENIMYPSHVSRFVQSASCVDKSLINIQIGNSADPSNNHIEIIDALDKLGGVGFKVYCPLSYGDDAYREVVINYGRMKFGENFIPLTSFMSAAEYNEYMGGIDIAIFNHRRQQAMGNIIGLISLGKKVYLRSEVTSFDFLRDKGFFIYSYDSGIDLERISVNKSERNVELSRVVFSEEKLLESWRRVFDE